MNDLWTARDFPVLVATAQLLDDGAGGPVNENKIAKATALDRSDVVKALINLNRRYLDVNLSRSWGGDVALAVVVGITAEGLEATGAWPSPETAVDRFLAGLDRAIDETAEGTPKASRLQALRNSAASISRDVLVEVMGGVLSGRIPM